MLGDSIYQFSRQYATESITGINCNASAETLDNCTIATGDCPLEDNQYYYYYNGEYYYYYNNYDGEFRDFVYVRCFDGGWVCISLTILLCFSSIACQVNISEVSCPLGYEFDIEQCQCVIVDICVASQPCQNGGTCIQEARESYRCSCPLYFTGYNCQGKY